MSKQRKEIDVDEAARILKVSERMVRSYIREKRVKALKVGKKWFIDLASVQVLADERVGAPVATEDLPEASSAEPLPLPEVAEVPEAIGSKNAEIPEVAEVTQKREGPERLASFCLFKKWSLPETLPSISVEDQAALIARIHCLRQEALEAWGAGFYSHGEDKALYYQKARAALGGIVGLIHGWALESKPQESLFLEQEVLPALSALIRAVKRPRKFRGKPEAKGSES